MGRQTDRLVYLIEVRRKKTRNQLEKYEDGDAPRQESRSSFFFRGNISSAVGILLNLIKAGKA